MATNYTVLVSAIVDTAENSDTAFTSAIPQFVERAQYRLHRDLDTYGYVAYTTVTGTSANPLLTKTSAALIIKSLYRLSGTRREPMLLQTDEYIAEYWPDRTSVGNPKYYANWGFGQWLIAPCPSATTSFEVSYVAVPTSLGYTTSTNWLTDYAPEALFYASMQEACLFMKNYEAATTWEGKYKEAVGTILNEGRRTRQDDQQNNWNPTGADNNLIKGQD